MPVSSAVIADDGRVGLLDLADVMTGYPGVPVVHGVSLRVRTGEVVVVLGPNGCGKSTLLKGVVGLLPITSGSVRYGGTEVTGLRTEKLVARGVGYVPQGDDTFAGLTVKENLELGGYALGRRNIGARVQEVFDQMPIISRFSRRSVGTLSGGERKLVAISRALMTHPKLLILDEPTASLTPAMSEMILSQVVRDLADSGIGVLLVEQKAMEALAIGDVAHVLVNGKVTLTDRPEALADRDRLRAAFLGVPAGSHDAPADHRSSL